VRLCIAGKNRIAVEALELLRARATGADLCALPNPSDDGRDGWQPSFRNACTRLRMPMVTVSDLAGVDDLVLVSLEYERLLPVGEFRSKRLFNVHFSLLPRYRGAYTSIWPILNGEQSSGVTLHFIDAGIDTGDIVAQSAFMIGENDTSRDLYFKYMHHGIELLKANLDRIMDGRTKGQPQAASRASFYSRRSLDFADIRIDLKRCAQQVHDQVRAFCFPEYQLPELLGFRIAGSRITATRSQHRPGHLVESTREHLEVATIDYNVRLLRAVA
jgi:methionyl-tRNA formyltransferase